MLGHVCRLVNYLSEPIFPLCQGMGDRQVVRQPSQIHMPVAGYELVFHSPPLLSPGDGIRLALIRALYARLHPDSEIAVQLPG
jgi:hypothetical protein